MAVRWHALLSVLVAFGPRVAPLLLARSSRRSRSSLGLVVTLVLAACVPVTLPGQTTPPPPPGTPPASADASASAAASVPGDMTAALRAKPIPYADGFDLVRRMEGRDGTPAKPFEPVRTTPPFEEVGSAQELWIYDFVAKRNVRVAVTLRRMTDSVKWWVQSDLSVDETALARSAQVFQERIYPTNRRLFGEEWSPGIDADPRINIVIARMPGAAAGYFSATDGLPRWVNEFSAEREMIYMNALAARIGTDNFHAILAHEFCHMQQFNGRVRSAVWFNEGFAQLCERANGFVVGFEQLFLRQPDTQLDAWSELDEGAAQHYGAAFLFLEYLRHRTGGGYGLMNSLLAEGIDTVVDLDRALRAAGHPPFEELLADFVAANAFVGAGAESRYSYPADLRLREPARPTTQDRLAVGGILRSSVHQQAARYIELPTGTTYRLRFDGARTARVIPTDPHSGLAFWWSDRADGMDSALTREVDLTRVRSAALSFWTWYDIEKDFDYGYIAVSADGGRRWETVAAAATTTSDPNGNNLGHGFTGRSGNGSAPVWVQQRADLTPYAGKTILLRFEHVTDGALTGAGFAIDDIEIPEVGYRDDAEGDNGWDANGFIRSTNTVRQRYIVQVLRSAPRPSVERHVVEDGKLEIDVDASAGVTNLAVTPLAPRTTDPAAFEVQLTPKR